ncbi:formylglycine-generating enzyme family protein [Aequorivita sp. F47161]|jgi:formylglycine-generating enzyme required for sulfatase activity|uniref:Formylglycine-generating enzyme family protein n=1 Tax=Aequorivita vitellina TaxID=2874475 RepID=A0A9X1QUU2_9FLAO|nr:formylglycine-generating enzyme family protein [Aequorivita vitellina]MCG2419170.1 formylglycine-generating enzyme family protein [Aequorivita vitellina]
MKYYSTALFLVFSIFCELYAQNNKMVLVEGGVYLPLYGAEGKTVKVAPFLMDALPVTNADYLKFVQENPKWKKSNVKSLFADKSYLAKWTDDTTFTGLKDAPVNNVSWFAAKNYCECQGKRLPTIDEWEYAAMADENVPDARKIKTYNQYILNWYETPKTFNKPVGSTFKNYWGIYDLHGLVWEWTQDFNAVLISGESRKDVDKDANLFCGSAAIGASDLMNYAAFMRFAFRGSMKARYSSQNLGFRCAKDIEN